VADAGDLRRRLRSLQAQTVARACRDDIVPTLRRVLWRDTGDTAERTHVEEIRTRGSVVSATIETPTPQANYQEYGTRPHIIRPRRRQALRFNVGGRVVFAKIVHHPGNRARPRFFPTIRRRFEPALQNAWRSLAR
jgi:hypothetical protein